MALYEMNGKEIRKIKKNEGKLVRIEEVNEVLKEERALGFIFMFFINALSILIGVMEIILEIDRNYVLNWVVLLITLALIFNMIYLIIDYERKLEEKNFVDEE